MNQAEKEAYLREYSTLKNQGKPFFPYAVAKDSLMAVIVMGVIIFLTLMFGAELGPKGNPTSTTYVPRPDWYFFFLFEVLRIMKNAPMFTPMAAIGVPTICMAFMFLLPFYDRSPERRIERRPVALATGIAVILAMALMTYDGSHTGSPNSIDLQPPATLSAAEKAAFTRGELAVPQAGCTACHKIGDNGNNGPGPVLTHIGSRLQPDTIASTLRNPTPPMPSFKHLAQASPQQFNDIVQFLSLLR